MVGMIRFVCSICFLKTAKLIKVIEKDTHLHLYLFPVFNAIVASWLNNKLPVIIFRTFALIVEWSDPNPVKKVRIRQVPELKH